MMLSEHFGRIEGKWCRNLKESGGKKAIVMFRNGIRLKILEMPIHP